MEKSLNENTSFQLQDETFTEGLAKIMQANISSYIAGQRREQQELNRKSRAICDTMEAMKNMLEDQNKQQETFSQEIRNGIQQLLSQSGHRSEEWKSTTLEMQKSISDVFDEIKSIKTTMEMQEEKQKKSEKDQAMLNEQISRLNQEREGFKEFRDEWELYHQFRLWQPTNQAALQIPKGDNFINFIATCAHQDAVRYLFQYVSGSIWKLSVQDIKMYDRMIDFCISVQNRIYGKAIYKRAHVEADEDYSMNAHQSHSDDPAVGTIEQVLLQGVLDGHNKIIFKSFVRVKDA